MKFSHKIALDALGITCIDGDEAAASSGALSLEDVEGPSGRSSSSSSSINEKVAQQLQAIEKEAAAALESRPLVCNDLDLHRALHVSRSYQCEVDLTDCDRLTDVGFCSLLKCDRVRKLCLRGTHFRRWDVLKDCLPGLRHLDVSRSGVEALPHFMGMSNGPSVFEGASYDMDDVFEALALPDDKVRRLDTEAARKRRVAMQEATGFYDDTDLDLIRDATLALSETPAPLPTPMALCNLNLRYTAIDELGPLTACSALRFLDLGCCANIVDVSPLSSLPELQSLYLDSAGVKSVACLQGLCRFRDPPRSQSGRFRASKPQRRYLGPLKYLNLGATALESDVDDDTIPTDVVDLTSRSEAFCKAVMEDDAAALETWIRDGGSIAEKCHPSLAKLLEDVFFRKYSVNGYCQSWFDFSAAGRNAAHTPSGLHLAIVCGSRECLRILVKSEHSKEAVWFGPLLLAEEHSDKPKVLNVLLHRRKATPKLAKLNASTLRFTPQDAATEYEKERSRRLKKLQKTAERQGVPLERLPSHATPQSQRSFLRTPAALANYCHSKHYYRQLLRAQGDNSADWSTKSAALHSDILDILDPDRVKTAWDEGA